MSRKAEPVDQLDGILLSKRMGCSVLPYIAGRYGILNSRTPKKDDISMIDRELSKKEENKADLLRAIGNVFDAGCMLLTTEDLWQSEEYWEIALELTSKEGIMSDCRSGILLRDIPINLISSTRAFSDFYAGFAGIAANSLYTLLEVAEAAYLNRKFNIDTKIGPSSEERYDRFIGQFMNVIQMSQPLSLGSKRNRPLPVIPYIEKEGEARVTFNDTKAEVDRKVFRCAQRSANTPPYWQLDGNGVLNPFVRLALIGILSSEALGNLPVRLNSTKVLCAEDVVSLAKRTEGRDYMRWAGVICEIIWNVIEKVNSQLGKSEAEPKEVAA